MQTDFGHFVPRAESYLLRHRGQAAETVFKATAGVRVVFYYADEDNNVRIGRFHTNGCFSWCPSFFACIS